MINKTSLHKLILLFVASLLLFPLVTHAQTKGSNNLDQIVAVVNNHIVLKSEIDQQVQQVMLQRRQRNRPVKFGKDLWYTVLQNTVDNFVLLDEAKNDSTITVSPSQIDKRIDARINRYVDQLGSREALEKRMGKSIVQIRVKMRKNLRQQFMEQKFRQKKEKDIDITRPEVKSFFNKIPKDSLPNIPEEVSVSQIVIQPKPLQDAKKKAHEYAEQIRDSIINHGKTIQEMARKYSDGPSSTNGGNLGMISVDDLVPSYSAAAAALKPGEISQVVQTSFGYHIIRLNKRKGDKINTSQVLIKIKDKSYNDKGAKKRLNQLRDSVLNNNNDFGLLARKFSEDPNTSSQGGRILNPKSGERLIPLQQLDPAMYQIVLLLDNVGDISSPRPFRMGKNNNNSKKAFRIVRLDNHVAEHLANLKQDYRRIKRLALQQKRLHVISNWISDLRKENYVKYKINIPKQYVSS